jgi:hypothetical protein
MEGDIQAPMYRRVIGVGAWSKKGNIAATGERFAGRYFALLYWLPFDKSNARFCALLLPMIDDLYLTTGTKWSREQFLRSRVCKVDTWSFVGLELGAVQYPLGVGSFGCSCPWRALPGSIRSRTK